MSNMKIIWQHIQIFPTTLQGIWIGNIKIINNTYKYFLKLFLLFLQLKTNMLQLDIYVYMYKFISLYMDVMPSLQLEKSTRFHTMASVCLTIPSFKEAGTEQNEQNFMMTSF